MSGCLPDLCDVQARLGLPEMPDRWRAEWGKSCSSMPEDAPWFLTAQGLTEANRILRLPENAFEALAEAAAFIRDDDDLKSLIWHCHRMLYSPLSDELSIDPFVLDLTSCLGDRSGLFLTLTLLSGFRRAAECYEKRGIPESVFKATMDDLPLWMNDYFRKHGRWGLENLWLQHHFSFRLFRLGRLQFGPSRFHGCVRVFRNRQTGEVMALAETGIRFRSDGLFDGTNGRFDAEGLWKSLLNTEGLILRGHPVTPSGIAVKNTETFPAEIWETVLREGDPVLDVHIPADGKLVPGLVDESIRLAEQFFKRYFPELRYAAYVCTSWLLDPQFAELLPSSSNIVQFQRQFHLYQGVGDDNEALRRIFGRLYSDWTKAPQDTAIRRAAVRHLSEGKAFRDTGGFILLDNS